MTLWFFIPDISNAFFQVPAMVQCGSNLIELMVFEFLDGGFSHFTIFFILFSGIDGLSVSRWIIHFKMESITSMYFLK